MRTPREETLSCFSHLSIDALDKLHATYVCRNDSYHAGIVQEAIAQHGKVQTTELANCGKLFKHTHFDKETGRITHTFTGDIGAMLDPFTRDAGPITCRLDTAQFTGANSPQARAYAASQRTVTVKPGERVIVVKD